MNEEQFVKLLNVANKIQGLISWGVLWLFLLMLSNCMGQIQITYAK